MTWSSNVVIKLLPTAITKCENVEQVTGYKMTSKNWDRATREVAVLVALKNRTCVLFLACLGETVASHLVVFNQVCCYLVQSMLIMNLQISFLDGQHLMGASVCKQRQAHTFF